jgi:hypothetical protein
MVKKSISTSASLGTTQEVLLMGMLETDSGTASARFLRIGINSFVASYVLGLSGMANARNQYIVSTTWADMYLNDTHKDREAFSETPAKTFLTARF